MAQHVESPGHTPGTLPDCPACDIELARQAYVQASRGTACPAEAMEMLDKPHRRLVELALLADQVARNEAIPVRDALHKLSFNDRQKHQVAQWVCPDYAEDWTGSIDDRMQARQEADDRGFERMNDRVLAVVAGLDPEDWSLEAQQARETAASIRDHRMNRLRQQEQDETDREEALLSGARLEFLVRDEKRKEAEEANDQQDWDTAALAALAMQRADQEGNRLVLESIEHANRAKDLAREFEQLWAANRAYDAEVQRRGLK